MAIHFLPVMIIAYSID